MPQLNETWHSWHQLSPSDFWVTSPSGRVPLGSLSEAVGCTWFSDDDGIEFSLRVSVEVDLILETLERAIKIGNCHELAKQQFRLTNPIIFRQCSVDWTIIRLNCSSNNSREDVALIWWQQHHVLSVLLEKKRKNFVITPVSWQWAQTQRLAWELGNQNMHAGRTSKHMQQTCIHGYNTTSTCEIHNSYRYAS